GAVWMGRGLSALRLNKDAPAGAEAAHGVVDGAGDGDQLGGDGGIQIGTAKLRGALERTVLVQDDARAEQCGPWQIVGEPGGGAAMFGKVHHARALTSPNGRGCADPAARLRRIAD